MSIVTFYSYKGGLGRSMTLANVAWILAGAGKRVLVIDWHLDAPGLHRYFAPFLLDPLLEDTRGLIDFITEYAASAAAGESGRAANILRYAVSLEWKFPYPGGIDLVGAGRSGPSFSVTVNAFSWSQFFERMGGARFLEELRDRVRNEYDYILIDAQPGTSDVSGICVVTMPDVLVVCCGLNYQNIEGAAAVAKSAAYGKRSLPVRIYPALMRVDWSEKQMLDEARQAAAREFEPVMSHIPDRQRYWGEVEFPYMPYYSYVEVLAPFLEGSRTPHSVLASAERLTAHITSGEVTDLAPIPDAMRRAGLEAFLRRKRF
jgi:hypothetical protein